MIRPYALHKHFANVRQEAPVIVLMIVIAGSAFALTSNHIWPLIWAAGFLALFTVDTWFAGWLLRSGRNHLRSKSAAIQLGTMCALTVCGFMIAPIAMIATGELALAIAATAMLAASATRATGILSVSRLSGSMTLAPFLALPLLSLWHPYAGHKAHPEFSHCVACLAAICGLAYVIMAWRTRDIVERKLERARREALVQGRAAARDAMISKLIFKHTSMRAALFDTEARFMAVNDAWLGAVQLSEQDVLGKTMAEAMPSSKQDWHQAIALALTGVSSQQAGDHRVRLDGAEVYLDWEVHPWYTPDGKIGGAIGYAQDVTEVFLARADEKAKQQRLTVMIARAQEALDEKRKLLEEICGPEVLSLKPSQPSWHEKLEILKEPLDLSGDQDPNNQSAGQLLAGFERVLGDIDQRDHLLATAVQQLSEARQNAETASQAKSQLMANVSHELRTPLHAILGYTEMLIEDAEQDGRQDAARDARKVQDSAHHLLKLINEILDLAKIEAGKMEVTQEPVNLNELADEVLQSLGPLAKNRGNQLVLIPSEEPIVLLTDGFRLRQCLMNLISNAIKFTQDGEVAISFDRKTSPAGRSHYEINVTDTGIGMSAEAQSRLFEPFQQGDGSVTRVYGGTGLGLALTREMMQLLGGTVGVESVAGLGSTFTLSLPAKGLQAKDVDVQIAADEAAPLILVIDDDEVSNTLALRAAQSLGLNSAMASTGSSALAYLANRAVDLVILNLELPDMDGYACLAALRANAALNDTPIVVIAADDDQRKSIALGAQEHFMKPILGSVLGAAIARLIRPKSEASHAETIELPRYRLWRANS
ncbi:MAG: ATP-binding protein [Hyphomonadaceae bacterium]